MSPSPGRRIPRQKLISKEKQKRIAAGFYCKALLKNEQILLMEWICLSCSRKASPVIRKDAQLLKGSPTQSWIFRAAKGGVIVQRKFRDA